MCCYLLLSLLLRLPCTLQHVRVQANTTPPTLPRDRHRNARADDEATKEPAAALAAVCASIVWSPLLREWRCDHCTVPAFRRGHVATRCVQLCLVQYGVVQRIQSHQRAIVREAPVLFETWQQCRRSQLKDRW